VKVYLEAGQKKVFAVAIDWIGLARSGKTEEAALETLFDYVPRYLESMGAGLPDLAAPRSVRDFDVVERVPGNATTDFGAPGIVSSVDEREISDVELASFIQVQRQAWLAFDRAAEAATDHELAPSGPRGGGRELGKIREHVSGGQAGYVGAVGGKARETDPWEVVQDAFLAAVRARARGEAPDVGPRGGRRWPARFAIRRSAWHALDHAWEIEDRKRRADIG
jgi:hypothetical protein